MRFGYYGVIWIPEVIVSLGEIPHSRTTLIALPNLKKVIILKMNDNITFADFNKNLETLCAQFQLLERSQVTRYEGKSQRLIITLSVSNTWVAYLTRCFAKCLMSGSSDTGESKEKDEEIKKLKEKLRSMTHANKLFITINGRLKGKSAVSFGNWM